MNASARLERDLTEWMSETAMPHMPDYADDILDHTARTRQRPRWTFVSRWLPSVEIRWVAPVRRETAVRMVSLLVVLAVILAAIAVTVGSRRALPPPFGLAGNGLLSSTIEGDVVVIDPRTMATRTIVAAGAVDRDAHWALDGTRLAFIREMDDGLALVIADAEGQELARSMSFTYLDSDSIAWSPDGGQIAISAARGAQAISLIDAATGAARELGVPHDGFEVYWRPPDGRELLFRIRGEPGGLGIASVADDTYVRVPMTIADRFSIRPLGWTLDGRRVLFQDDSTELPRTVVVDVETGAQTTLDVAYGHVSNGGTRVAGLDSHGQFCVASIAGGPCNVVEGAGDVEGVDGATVRWSPDDRWIAIGTSPVRLVDPANIIPPRALVNGGPGSWQRTAP